MTRRDWFLRAPSHSQPVYRILKTKKRKQMGRDITKSTSGKDNRSSGVAVPRPTSCISALPRLHSDQNSVRKVGVMTALSHLSSSYLNIPSQPSLPFVTLWVTHEVGEKISKETVAS